MPDLTAERRTAEWLLERTATLQLVVQLKLSYTVIKLVRPQLELHELADGECASVINHLYSESGKSITPGKVAAFLAVPQEESESETVDPTASTSSTSLRKRKKPSAVTGYVTRKSTAAATNAAVWLLPGRRRPQAWPRPRSDSRRVRAT
jgi:hypothetical protein